MSAGSASSGSKSGLSKTAVGRSNPSTQAANGAFAPRRSRRASSRWPSRAVARSRSSRGALDRATFCRPAPKHANAGPPPASRGGRPALGRVPTPPVRAPPRGQALGRQRVDFRQHRLDSGVVRSADYNVDYCTPDERRRGTFGIGFVAASLSGVSLLRVLSSNQDGHAPRMPSRGREKLFTTETSRSAHVLPRATSNTRPRVTCPRPDPRQLRQIASEVIRDQRPVSSGAGSPRRFSKRATNPRLSGSIGSAGPGTARIVVARRSRETR